MWEFLKSYGIWILAGVLFLLMLRVHRLSGHGRVSGRGGSNYTEPSGEENGPAEMSEPNGQTSWLRERLINKGGQPQPGRLRYLQIPLFFTMALWLCTLPLVLILAVPFLGMSQAWAIAAVVLVAYLAVCLYLCRFSATRKASGEIDDRQRGNDVHQRRPKGDHP